MDITKPMTYGTFIDAMETVATAENASGNFEASAFVWRWKQLATPEQWADLRVEALVEGGVLNFVEDMVGYYQEALNGTCTEALYVRQLQNGHAFLKAIHTKLTELGIIIELEVVDVPLTPTDFMVRAGVARIVSAEA